MRGLLGLVAVASFLFAGAAGAGELPADIVDHLEKDPYVYISSTRESGALGSAAEIWFEWADGSVLVGTSTKSYRVRRIKAGRTGARIWVEKAGADWFDASGALVEDKATQDQLMAAFTRKYGDSFVSKWESRFREGFADKTRVIVRYTPTGPAGAGPTGLPAKK